MGHTGITWGFAPADAERAIADVASLGYHGYESFGNVLEAWEAKGGLDKVLQAAKLPLRSAYCPVNLTDPNVRPEEVAKIVRWGQLIKKGGGSVAVPSEQRQGPPTVLGAQDQHRRALNGLPGVDGIGVVGVLTSTPDVRRDPRQTTP